MFAFHRAVSTDPYQLLVETKSLLLSTTLIWFHYFFFQTTSIVVAFQNEILWCISHTSHVFFLWCIIVHNRQTCMIVVNSCCKMKVKRVVTLLIDHKVYRICLPLDLPIVSNCGLHHLKQPQYCNCGHHHNCITPQLQYGPNFQITVMWHHRTTLGPHQIQNKFSSIKILHGNGRNRHYNDRNTRICCHCNCKHNLKHGFTKRTIFFVCVRQIWNWVTTIYYVSLWLWLMILAQILCSQSWV